MFFKTKFESAFIFLFSFPQIQKKMKNKIFKFFSRNNKEKNVENIDKIKDENRKLGKEKKELKDINLLGLNIFF